MKLVSGLCNINPAYTRLDLPITIIEAKRREVSSYVFLSAIFEKAINSSKIRKTELNSASSMPSYIYADKIEKPINSDSFMIDIRKTITYDNDNVYFSITDNYWSYLCELLDINNSVNTNKTKINDRLELYAKYAKSNESDIIWLVTIPKEKFHSYIQYDNELIPYCENNNSNTNNHKPTKEQIENVLKFFGEIQK